MLRPNDSPAVNFVNGPIPPRGTVGMFKVLSNPFNEVVFEDTLNELV